MRDLHVTEPAAAMRWPAWLAVIVAMWLVLTAVQARGPLPDREYDYIVQLSLPGLAVAPETAAFYSARSAPADAQAASAKVGEYRTELATQRQQVLMEAARMLGRDVRTRHEYQHLLNGFSLRMTPAEAARLEAEPAVTSVMVSRAYQLHLDAGPPLIGAPEIWNGVSGIAARGEGMIVGVIDSGINREHPFFAGESQDGFVFSNPRPAQLGLCTDPAFPQVECNGKLIGIYDFTTEGERDGSDLNGHGSHVASIAAGNPMSLQISATGTAPVTVTASGVAPRAHLISYKACQAREDEPPGTPPSCQGLALVDALDQALADGVDVVNLSIGGEVREDPWLYLRLQGVQDISEILLSMREQGVPSVASAGNSGPSRGTVSSPAIGPWTVAAGNITHGRERAKTLQNLAGGGTAPPENVIGVGDTPGTLGTLPIVHARDFGSALCGAGPAELGPSCGDNTGASNPFLPGTFNGQIVVCDRGTYGRVEKGFNAQQAGAGGMILANTDLEAEEVIADRHCLPALHIGDRLGDAMRAWLASGTGHRGRISETEIVNDPFFAGRLAGSSSVGPNPSIPGILKPNLVAPGTNILGASFEGEQFLFLSGTSMAAPHVTGSIALLKSARPGWNNEQVISALETTAIWPLPGSGAPAGISADQRGAGVPVLGEAVRAGLYLPVSGQDFRDADPEAGGDPAQINLPGIQFIECGGDCSVTRQVRDMMGGGRWTVTTDADFLEVTPAVLDLDAGEQATITITGTLDTSNLIGGGRSGRVILTSDDAPDGMPLQQSLPVSIIAPDDIRISTARARDRRAFVFGALPALPQARLQPSLLKIPEVVSTSLSQDPTRNNPFDSDEGTFTEFIDIPGNILQLRAETAGSSAPDIDLFIGRDNDDDGVADASEELCSSITPESLESCIIDTPEPGRYWIMIQVFQGSTNSSDNVRLRYAVLNQAANAAQQNLFVRGPGVAAAGESLDVMLGWDLGQFGRDDTAWGVIAVGRDAGATGDAAMIPVTVTRTAVETMARALPLFDGEPRTVTLAAGARQNRMFVDIAPNVTAINIGVQGAGASLRVVSMPFSEAFAEQPGVLPAPSGSLFNASANAAGRIDLSVTSGNIMPGRWYLVLRNNGLERSFDVGVDLEFDPAGQVASLETAYTRDGSTRQGIDFGRVGSHYGVLWYTFDEQGQPIFYNFAGPVPGDGASGFSGGMVTPVSDRSVQQNRGVGRAGVTFLDETSFIMSYDLLGRSGSELMRTIASELTCPSGPAGQVNVHGVWDILPGAQGGISMLALASSQGYIRYFYDDSGQARWLLGTAPGNVVDNPKGALVQIRGFCPDCDPVIPTTGVVGSFAHAFAGDFLSGTQSVDLELDPPLSGRLNESVDIVRLSRQVQCSN